MSRMSTTDAPDAELLHYVSVTGFTPKNGFQLPRFWWHTLRCLNQARRSSGNLGVSARYVSRVYYTMTVWSDEESARAFVSLGAHRKAMSNFRSMGSGKTFGYRSSSLPQWEMAYSLWSRYGKDV